MKIRLLFTVGFILFLSVCAFAGQLYINGQPYNDYSSITISSSGKVEITTAASPPPSGNTIAGRVTSVFFGAGKTIGIGGVTMALSGSSPGTSTTDTNGNYTFISLADGSYTVTPSHGSYTFNPASGSANVASNQTATVNFDASPVAGKTYSIAGNVKDKNGANLPGVTMQLQWGSTVLDNTDLTGADGNYVIGDLPDGLTYTVTPIMTGKSFNPASQNVLVNGSNVTGKNFVEPSGPSGPLGSKTNPIKINKPTSKILNGYIPSPSPDDSRGSVTIPTGAKAYFEVDPLTTTGRSVDAFGVTVKSYTGGAVVCKLTQDKITGTYSSETCQGYSAFMSNVYDNQPYDIDKTRFLYAIDNSSGGASASDDIWATIP